jgi:hypothetical protein
MRISREFVEFGSGFFKAEGDPARHDYAVRVFAF